MPKSELQRIQDDIKIIRGNSNLLLIAPHGVATRPKDDINTDKLTYRIAERLKCSAIVNDVFKRTDLDFNDVAKASAHNTFIPAIRKVVDASNPTLVIWVHGIDDSNLKKEIAEMGVNDNVQCLVGFGQPNRPTAEERTVDGLIRAFRANSIIAHVARPGSNYGGNSNKYMNQWFRLNGYKLSDVQSVQLEFGYEGVRRAEDLVKASQNIANALSNLFMKIPAEYSAINGGDECGAGVGGMQSPSKFFKKPRLLRRGVSLISLLMSDSLNRHKLCYHLFSLLN